MTWDPSSQPSLGSDEGRREEFGISVRLDAACLCQGKIRSPICRLGSQTWLGTGLVHAQNGCAVLLSGKVTVIKDWQQDLHPANGSGSHQRLSQIKTN